MKFKMEYWETFKGKDGRNMLDALETWEYPVVIKLNGLAEGKGVVIANNFREAIEALNYLSALNLRIEYEKTIR